MPAVPGGHLGIRPVGGGELLVGLLDLGVRGWGHGDRTTGLRDVVGAAGVRRGHHADPHRKSLAVHPDRHGPYADIALLARRQARGEHPTGGAVDLLGRPRLEGNLPAELVRQDGEVTEEPGGVPGTHDEPGVGAGSRDRDPRGLARRMEDDEIGAERHLQAVRHRGAAEPRRLPFARYCTATGLVGTPGGKMPTMVSSA